MKQLIIPVIVTLLTLGLFIPIPEIAIDYLVITNCILGFILLLSVLLVKKPLALSTFPSFLLILTLFRLVTNVSSTRLILSSSEPGSIIPLIGEIAIQGSLVIGIVIFLILTFIQLIVISKGAERVAEVSARFTLDALPGKQMSIDADVRAGLIDFNEARNKRQELQAESRFYGALDGAMKFIKGDAVIGILITLINLIGGLVIGVTIHQLNWQTALSQYSLFTIGDGVISQLPAILNSIAAGILVTRVVNNEHFNLSEELFRQVFGEKSVQILIVSFCLLLAVLPGLPALPFLCLSILCFILYLAARSIVPNVPPDHQSTILLPESKMLSITLPENLVDNLVNLKTELTQKIYQQSGLLIDNLNFSLSESSTTKIFFYDCQIAEIDDCPEQIQLLKKLTEIFFDYSQELVSDQVIKDILNYQRLLGKDYYFELVPEVIPIAKITRIYKALLNEQVAPVQFDLVMQILAEYADEKVGIRYLIKEIRIAHKYQISNFHTDNNQISAITLDPEIDLHFYQLEQEAKEINIDYIKKIIETAQGIIKNNQSVNLLTSANSRMIVKDCLQAIGSKIRVIAFEELLPQIKINSLGCIKIQEAA